MTNQEDLTLIEFTVGLYEQSLKLLKPGSENFSILSGCILLTVGLEKLIKSVLYDENPLMILYDKIDSKDLIKFQKGDKFRNCKTISFEKALALLVELFPALKKEPQDIKDIEYIIKERNLLMHNFGYINIGALEIKIQTKVADISELICKECLRKSPEEVFGLNVWTEMVKTREAYKTYKDANILELKQRILHLRRLYLQNRALSFEEIDIPKGLYTQVTRCPVCNKNTAEVAMECDVDFDEYGILSDVSPYLSLLKCECGFTIVDIEEIELLLGEEKYYDIIESIKSSSRESA
jgi:hypothetical protein